MPVTLRLQKTTPADPEREWVAAEFYAIVAEGVDVGVIQLRLGDTEALRLYGGHVGYGVEPEHRGQGYATAAVRAMRAIARQHGFAELWMTCRTDNRASQRVLEKAGAHYVETIAVPRDHDLYARGNLEMQRYRLHTGD
jgi:predicted acetyltransferase